MGERSRQPWAQGNLVLSTRLLESICEEALAAYPRDEESCGLLVGRADAPLVVDAIVPMKNRANGLHALDPEAYPRTGRVSFDIDPLAFYRNVQGAAAEGRPVKVLYHSHLDASAYFSETDALASTMGGSEPAYDVAYLVTSVKAGVIAEHALFVWDPVTRTFAPSPLRIALPGEAP